MKPVERYKATSLDQFYLAPGMYAGILRDRIYNQIEKFITIKDNTTNVLSNQLLYDNVAYTEIILKNLSSLEHTHKGRLHIYLGEQEYLIMDIFLGNYRFLFERLR